MKYLMKSLSILIAAMLLASCSGMGMSGSHRMGMSSSGGSSGSYGVDGSDSDVPYSMRPFDDRDPYHGG